MRNWNSILFAKTLLVTTLYLCGHPAKAEDFCDPIGLYDVSHVKYEEKVRAKCKVGDIIIPGSKSMAARLCDFSKPTVYQGVCFLAPPRKTY